LISSNKSVDLLFALQRMKPDIYVVAQQFALRPRQSFFAATLDRMRSKVWF
jgi:hypothetical protein